MTNPALKLIAFDFELNTDIRGGEDFGIRTVWVSGADYRSDDDEDAEIEPSRRIQRLAELPALLKQVGVAVGQVWPFPLDGP